MTNSFNSISAPVCDDDASLTTLTNRPHPLGFARTRRGRREVLSREVEECPFSGVRAFNAGGLLFPPAVEKWVCVLVSWWRYMHRVLGRGCDVSLRGFVSSWRSRTTTAARFVGRADCHRVCSQPGRFLFCAQDNPLSKHAKKSVKITGVEDLHACLDSPPQQHFAAWKCGSRSLQRTNDTTPSNNVV